MAGRSNYVASSSDFLAALSPTEVKNSLNSFAMTEQSSRVWYNVASA